jgi:hypothetical protein
MATTEVTAMSPEDVAEFLKLISNFEPKWALAMLVAGILSWRLPQIIKEFFAGIRGLLVARKKRDW